MSIRSKCDSRSCTSGLPSLKTSPTTRKNPTKATSKPFRWPGTRNGKRDRNSARSSEFVSTTQPTPLQHPQFHRRPHAASQQLRGGSLTSRNLQITRAAHDDEQFARSRFRVVPGQAADGFETNRKLERTSVQFLKLLGRKIGDQVAEPVNLQHGAGPRAARRSHRPLEVESQVIGDELAHLRGRDPARQVRPYRCKD